MKKTLFFVANLLIISTLSFAQDTPTADAIIEKYIAAIGGKDAIAKITDVSKMMNSERNGNTMETETKFKMPNKFRQSTYAAGNEMRLMICDGTKLYSKQQGFGNRPEQIDTKEGKDAQAGILENHPFAETLYAENKIVGAVLGTEAVDGKDAYKVEFTSEDGKKWTDFFDKTSGLKVKRTALRKSPMGETTATILFQNYKEVGGIKFPYIIDQNFGQFQMKQEIQSVKVNKGLKDGDFVIK